MTHLHRISAVGGASRGHLHNGEVEFGGNATAAVVVGVCRVKEAVGGALGGVGNTSYNHVAAIGATPAATTGHFTSSAAAIADLFAFFQFANRT